MKNLLISILLAALSVSRVADAQNSAPPQSTTHNGKAGGAEQAKMARKLRRILPILRKDCPVPPRLITYFPRLEKADDLYINILSADSSGYEVIVGFVPDCEGQNVCGYAILRGSKTPLDHEGQQGQEPIPVRLKGGILARYYDTECAGYCSYSVVTWAEGKWQYAVELKAEKRALVIKAANSALGK